MAYGFSVNEARRNTPYPAMFPETVANGLADPRSNVGSEAGNNTFYRGISQLQNESNAMTGAIADMEGQQKAGDLAMAQDFYDRTRAADHLLSDEAEAQALKMNQLAMDPEQQAQEGLRDVTGVLIGQMYPEGSATAEMGKLFNKGKGEKFKEHIKNAREMYA